MNEKLLLRGVLLFVVLLLGISFLFPHKERLLERDEFSFTTTADSRLHFNNVRSYWYQKEEIPNQGADKFNYSKWDSEMDVSLRPLIINQWRVDEATLFLMPDVNGLSTERVDIILAEDTLSILMNELDRDAHIDIADKWYRHLDTTNSYILFTEMLGEVAPSDTEVKAVKAVLKDYFTLVNYLR
ncbi:MAG: hypothetical protein HWD92_03340 [Flavobacteriia bacterium]|nr:hypothetical protein [Flavobacteriia bacterium]